MAVKLLTKMEYSSKDEIIYIIQSPGGNFPEIENRYLGFGYDTPDMSGL